MSVHKKRVCVFLTKPYLDGMDHLVKQGIHLERQSVIRDALRIYLRAHRIPPFYVEAETFPMERIIEIMDYDFAFRLRPSDVPAYLDEDFEAGEGGESHDAFRVVDQIAMYLRELKEQKQKETKD
ncbi:unnamed protein product [marine sediment metagenome]|uniref:Ribbon-helix-helix protein CopG domain-containing protein n=1 Tax=marine sediment metagenome TaxID=412755 RepID=X1RAR6_9ZZZZ